MALNSRRAQLSRAQSSRAQLSRAQLCLRSIVVDPAKPYNFFFLELDSHTNPLTSQNSKTEPIDPVRRLERKYRRDLYIRSNNNVTLGSNTGWPSFSYSFQTSNSSLFSPLVIVLRHGL